MSFFVVRFEMRFQIAQRIDPRAAAFAERCALFRRPHGYFLKHGRQHELHGLLLRVIWMSRPRATEVPALPGRGYGLFFRALA